MNWETKAPLEEELFQWMPVALESHLCPTGVSMMPKIHRGIQRFLPYSSKCTIKASRNLQQSKETVCHYLLALPGTGQAEALQRTIIVFILPDNPISRFCQQCKAQFQNVLLIFILQTQHYCFHK